MATWSALNFQDSSSPLMEQLNFFHDHSIMILLIVTVMISYLMISMFMNKIINRFLLENQMVEMIWTILPSIILIFLALPSLRILYLMDELISPSLSLKTIGHQWYWSYEYSDFSDLDFDSYMIPQSQNSISDFRLLEVDNRMVIPTNTNIRLLVSSTDVIHSWAMPSLGLKMDANPGRINQLNFMTNYSGLFFGQCSEICGSLHSFMPIVIESTNKNNFITWLLKNSK